MGKIKQIHERIIKLKSQPRWVVRCFIIAGALLGGILALVSHPIGGTHAENDRITYLQNGDIKICGTEYVSDENGAYGCITIQGKNVGATTTGACRNAPSTSYGYYFQWGDNTTGYTEQNWSSGNIQSGNAWGGENDDFDEDGWKPTNSYPVDNWSQRQGPCDEGYHVPSQGEWYALIDMWAGTKANSFIGGYYIDDFCTDFQTPFVGHRRYEDGSLESQNESVNFWSSSSSSYDSWSFFLGEDSANAYTEDTRSWGYSVRCFKDEGEEIEEGESCYVTVAHKTTFPDDIELPHGSGITIYPKNFSHGSTNTCEEEYWECNNGEIEGSSRGDGFGYGSCEYNPDDGCGYSDVRFREGQDNTTGWPFPVRRIGYYGSYASYRGYTKVNGVCEENDYICGDGGHWYRYENGVTGAMVTDLYYYSQNCAGAGSCTTVEGRTVNDGETITGYLSDMPVGRRSSCNKVSRWNTDFRASLNRGWLNGEHIRSEFIADNEQSFICSGGNFYLTDNRLLNSASSYYSSYPPNYLYSGVVSAVYTECHDTCIFSDEDHGDGVYFDAELLGSDNYYNTDGIYHIRHGSSITNYPYQDRNCELQTLTCNEGTREGMVRTDDGGVFGYGSCEETSNSCELGGDGTELANGSTITAYVRSYVTKEQQSDYLHCEDAILRCNNGTLEYADEKDHMDPISSETISPNGYGFSSCEEEEEKESCYVNVAHKTTYPDHIELPHGSGITIYPTNYSFGSINKCEQETWICDDGAITGSSRWDDRDIYSGPGFGYGACEYNPDDRCGYSDIKYYSVSNNLTGWPDAYQLEGSEYYELYYGTSDDYHPQRGYTKVNGVCEENDYICGDGGHWYRYENGVTGAMVTDLYYYSQNCEEGAGGEIGNSCTLHDGTQVEHNSSIIAYQHNTMPYSFGCDYHNYNYLDSGNSTTLYCNNGKFSTATDPETYYDDIYEAKGYGWSSCEEEIGNSCTLHDGTQVEDNSSIIAYQHNTMPSSLGCDYYDEEYPEEGNWAALTCYNGKFATTTYDPETYYDDIYEAKGYGWSSCTEECESGYHTEDGETCTGNTKTVACTEIGKPENSEYIPGNVQITRSGSWNNGNWTQAANCEWSCESGYHTEDGETCTGNTKTVACTEIGKPENSEYIPGNVQVTWNGTWDNGNREQAANCAWSCDTNYHTGSNEESCEIDTYTVNVVSNDTNSGTVSTGSITVPYGTSITTGENTVTIGAQTITANSKDDTAQWDYGFVDWTNECGEMVSTGCTITANFESTLRSYTITWKNDDGSEIDTTIVEYGVVPIHASGTKEATAEWTYTFSGWNPEVISVEGEATYTAEFNATLNEYTASISSNNEEYGVVDIQSVRTGYGASITENGNKITIGEEEVVATANDATDQYTYRFTGWNNECGDELTGDCDITANFYRTTNKYGVTFLVVEEGYGIFNNMLGDFVYTGEYGELITISGNKLTIGEQEIVAIATGSTAEYTYEFSGWINDCGEEFTGTCTVTAEFSRTVNSYTITWIDEEGRELYSGEFEYGTMPSYSGTLPQKPATAEWRYEFSGWSPEVVAVEGDAEYQAEFNATKNSYTITWKNDDGSEIDTTIVEYGVVPSHASGTKEATAEYTYTFSGWNPEVVPVEGEAEYTAEFSRTVNSYTITWTDEDGTELYSGEFEYGTMPSYSGTIPEKSATSEWTYEFSGWNPEVVAVEGDATYTAEFKAIAISTPTGGGGGGGGGGGSSLKKDICPNGDYSDSYYDGKCGTNAKDSSAEPQNDKSGHNPADELVYDTLRFNPHYSDEMNKAYQYAHHYGITTKESVKEADMGGSLTRIAMAKMLSQYAINVLGQTPDTSKNNKFKDVSDQMDSEYDDGVTLAYQLGIMGINMPGNKFRPEDPVTRAEFVTALSRMKYKTPDGKDVYYSTHMELLKRLGVITNTNPSMLELRGYVMIMLMRAK